MALNSTGPISIGGSTTGQSINLELGRAANTTSSLNETSLRTLAGVASGAISLSNFYGKSSFSISGGTTYVSGADTRSGGGGKTVTTFSSASAGTISGGTSPFSYLWQYVSGDTFTPTTATSSSTTFSKILLVTIGETTTATGVYRCRVTDNDSNVIYGPNCTIELSLSETS